MADVFDQLEAAEKREERERDVLLGFVRQVAGGNYTKGRAVIRAKSLLREVSAPGVPEVSSPTNSAHPPMGTPKC